MSIDLHNWKQYDYDYIARTVMPDGDEVWTDRTEELGLPVIWIRHPNNTYEHYIVHTPGYSEDRGEHYCYSCHCMFEQHGSIWKCPICGDEFDQEELPFASAPSEEASYDYEFDPRDEWRADE